MSKILYIGLNGLAGSGKDTVAKMLKSILVKKWNNIEDCKAYYKLYFDNPNISATFTNNNKEKYQVFCIAFADQLKNICSSIFGIPVERFYSNKSNSWICINKDFKYTEIKPDEENIITAEEYYNNINNYKFSEKNYWMSLREILVYVGTYVCQQDLNKNVFVNIVKNNINNINLRNNSLKYVIVTDVRFSHEINYIRENNGITIQIVRDDVKALDNIAEHDLDDSEDFDYIIENNGSYDDLFLTVWNLVNENIEFKNIVKDMNTRDNIDNYLRLVYENEDKDVLEYKLCTPYKVNKVKHLDSEIIMVDPLGGPEMNKGDYISGTDLIIKEIYFDTKINKFILTVER